MFCIIFYSVIELIPLLKFIQVSSVISVTVCSTKGKIFHFQVGKENPREIK